MAHDMLHVINALCTVRDVHTIAPGPLERACWRQFATQRDCKKSRIAPYNAFIIIVIIIIFVIIIIIVVVVIVVVKL